jgi:hypothetical protein
MASVLELVCAQQLLEGCLITLTASTSKGLDPADATSYVYLVVSWAGPWALRASLGNLWRAPGACGSAVPYGLDPFGLATENNSSNNVYVK